MNGLALLTIPSASDFILLPSTSFKIPSCVMLMIPVRAFQSDINSVKSRFKRIFHPFYSFTYGQNSASVLPDNRVKGSFVFSLFHLIKIYETALI